MKRVAIVLEKNLDPGAIGNVAAILMGQASLQCPEIYDTHPVVDQSGGHHAAIRYSTVLLKAGQGQLLNFSEILREEYPNIQCLLFSEVGQSLHNAFGEYQRRISSTTTGELKPVGVLVVGEDEEVRAATKKFSLLR